MGVLDANTLPRRFGTSSNYPSLRDETRKHGDIESIHETLTAPVVANGISLATLFCGFSLTFGSLTGHLNFWMLLCSSSMIQQGKWRLLRFSILLFTTTINFSLRTSSFCFMWLSKWLQTLAYASDAIFCSRHRFLFVSCFNETWEFLVRGPRKTAWLVSITSDPDWRIVTTWYNLLATSGNQFSLRTNWSNSQVYNTHTLVVFFSFVLIWI